MDFDLGMALGAEEGYSSQRLTLYLPNKDRRGKKLSRLSKWTAEARELLSQIGRGSTTFPPADGNWVDDRGMILWEQTNEFLHRFGRETRWWLSLTAVFGGLGFDAPVGG
jgi:hypothetical protein